jgi:hypothetical protein
VVVQLDGEGECRRTAEHPGQLADGLALARTRVEEGEWSVGRRFQEGRGVSDGRIARGVVSTMNLGGKSHGLLRVVVTRAAVRNTRSAAGRWSPWRMTLWSPEGKRPAGWQSLDAAALGATAV